MSVYIIITAFALNLCSALVSVIQAKVEVTQVRVKRTDDGTVDVTRLDIIVKNCLLNDLVLLLGVEGLG